MRSASVERGQRGDDEAGVSSAQAGAHLLAERERRRSRRSSLDRR